MLREGNTEDWGGTERTTKRLWATGCNRHVLIKKGEAQRADRKQGHFTEKTQRTAVRHLFVPVEDNNRTH